ncbi:MAG: pantetheine-phosphate adenylyltransferase [Promethearchaeota archaeon]
MGGTFDHLHEGHKFLLRTALSVSKFIEIGLTSQNLLKKKKFLSKLESYKTRESKIKDYISSFTDIKRVNIVEIKNWDDMSGYSQDPEYDGLVVSQETYENALKLNKTRESKGMEPLILIVIPLIKDQFHKKLSSTAIRETL